MWVAPSAQILSRNSLLIQYVYRHLREQDLPDSNRNVLSALCLEWMQEQFDSLNKLEKPYSPQLIVLLQSPTCKFARKLVDDARVEPKIREGLKELLASIQELKAGDFAP